VSEKMTAVEPSGVKIKDGRGVVQCRRQGNCPGEIMTGRELSGSKKDGRGTVRGENKRRGKDCYDLEKRLQGNCSGLKN